MATIKVTNEVEQMLGRLSTDSAETCKKALYEGAKVLADAMKTEIQNLPTDERQSAPVLNGIRQAQKTGLLESFGVAPFDENDGTRTTHLGFDGYNSIVTKRWPNGQPNSMIARSINAGTSFMRATPFIDRTRRLHKSEAEKRMEEVIREEIKEETE